MDKPEGLDANGSKEQISPVVVVADCDEFCPLQPIRRLFLHTQMKWDKGATVGMIGCTSYISMAACGLY